MKKKNKILFVDASVSSNFFFFFFVKRKKNNDFLFCFYIKANRNKPYDSVHVCVYDVWWLSWT